MHVKVMISLVFAFTVMVLYICGAKMHVKVMIFLAFAFKVMILYICGAKCILQ